MQQHNPAPTSEFLKQALTQATEVALGTTGISKSKPLHTLVGASVAVCLFDTRLYSCAVRLVMLPTLAQSNRQDASLQADAALDLKFGSIQRVPAFVAHRLHARVRTIDDVESRYYVHWCNRRDCHCGSWPGPMVHLRGHSPQCTILLPRDSQ